MATTRHWRRMTKSRSSGWSKRKYEIQVSPSPQNVGSTRVQTTVCDSWPVSGALGGENMKSTTFGATLMRVMLPALLVLALLPAVASSSTIVQRAHHATPSGSLWVVAEQEAETSTRGCCDRRSSHRGLLLTPFTYVNQTRGGPCRVMFGESRGPGGPPAPRESTTEQRLRRT